MGSPREAATKVEKGSIIIIAFTAYAIAAVVQIE
jgi:hypothetical protein